MCALPKIDNDSSSILDRYSYFFYPPQGGAGPPPAGGTSSVSAYSRDQGSYSVLWPRLCLRQYSYPMIFSSCLYVFASRQAVCDALALCPWRDSMFCSVVHSRVMPSGSLVFFSPFAVFSVLTFLNLKIY